MIDQLSRSDRHRDRDHGRGRRRAQARVVAKRDAVDGARDRRRIPARRIRRRAVSPPSPRTMAVTWRSLAQDVAPVIGRGIRRRRRSTYSARRPADRLHTSAMTGWPEVEPEWPNNCIRRKAVRLGRRCARPASARTRRRGAVRSGRRRSAVRRSQLSRAAADDRQECGCRSKDAAR